MQQPAGPDPLVAERELDAPGINPAPEGCLQHPQFINARGELLKSVRVDCLSRLPRVVVYQVQVN